MEKQRSKAEHFANTQDRVLRGRLKEAEMGATRHQSNLQKIREVRSWYEKAIAEDAMEIALNSKRVE